MFVSRAMIVLFATLVSAATCSPISLDDLCGGPCRRLEETLDNDAIKFHSQQCSYSLSLVAKSAHFFLLAQVAPDSPAQCGDSIMFHGLFYTKDINGDFLTKEMVVADSANSNNDVLSDALVYNIGAADGQYFKFDDLYKAFGESLNGNEKDKPYDFMTNNCAGLVVDMFCNLGVKVTFDIMSFVRSGLLAGNAKDTIALLEHSSHPEAKRLLAATPDNPETMVAGFMSFYLAQKGSCGGE